MDTLQFEDFTSSVARRHQSDEDVVADDFPYRAFSRSQLDLLEQIPFPGAMISLDDALHVVSHDHAHPYGQIIVLMNRGIIEVEYDDRCIDPVILLRRL